MIDLYRPEDKAAIEELHRQMGFDYQMPDLDDPLCAVKQVWRKDGIVRAAGALRIQAEIYLWIDPDLKPREKWAAILELQRAGLKAAWNLGIDEVAAWIPARIRRSFRKRLINLNWSPARDGWRAWSRKTEG